MTVAELIAKLQKVPDQSLPVEIEVEDGDFCLEHYSVNSVVMRRGRYVTAEPTICISTEYGPL